MKITFVLDTFGGGGKERRCLQLIQGLNKAGYTNIQVIIVNGTVAYPELYDTTSEVIIIDRKNRGLSFFRTYREVKTLFKVFNPDIVQTWGGISTLIPILLKPLFNFKLIGAYVADADSPKKLSLTSFYPFFCNKIVGNSKIGLEAYRIPSKKAVLIYNGFNEKRLECGISKEGKKNSLNIHTSYVVAMIATFWPNKDWKCFINAAKIVIKERNDVTFLAIGDGPTWEEHNLLIDTSEISKIRMLGRRRDIDEILRACDISVLTSLHGEGISNSILESMAFGVPVIATNSGGTPEIIKDGENGLLLNENKSEVLAEKIVFLLNNRDVLQNMSCKAVNTIQNNFLLHFMTKRYIDLYNSLFLQSD